jgi:hypothetical protein
VAADTASTSVTSEAPSAIVLGQVARRQRCHSHRGPDERDDADDGQPGEVVISSSPTDTEEDDDAGEHRQGIGAGQAVLDLAQAGGRPADEGRQPAGRAVDPALVGKTRARVRWMPGRMKQALVDLVLVEVLARAAWVSRLPAGATSGTSSRQ